MIPIILMAIIGACVAITLFAVFGDFEKFYESTYKTKEERDAFRWAANLNDYWNTGEMGKRDHDFKF